MEQNNKGASVSEQVLMSRLQEEMQISINLQIQLNEMAKELEAYKEQHNQIDE